MSRYEKLRATLRDGERFVCLAPQGLPLVLPAPPTEEQIATTGGTCVRTDTQCGFRVSNGTISVTPSGACKLVLRRGGDTNEWQGPRHLFVERDGAWVSYKQLSS
jgi:hypothetical protein